MNVIRIAIPTISWAITCVTILYYMAVTTAMEDKNFELLSRLSTVTSTSLKEYKSEEKYKKEIRLLERSLVAVKRDMMLPDDKSIAVIRSNARKYFGKGGREAVAQGRDHEKQNNKSTIRNHTKKQENKRRIKSR